MSRPRLMTHDDVYDLCSIPGDEPPRPGDLIRTNYGTGLCTGYIVESARQITEEGGRLMDYSAGMWCFACSPNAGGGDGGHFYLNGYAYTKDGRLVGHALPEDSCGYNCNGGGRDGDGRDEILIERRAAVTTQPELF